LPAFLLIFLGTTIVAAIPRLFGVYRTNIADLRLNTDSEEVRGGQFRLIDLFAWTASAAVLAGIFRWAGLPRGNEWWFGIVVALPVAALMVLIALWTTLALTPTIVFRMAAALGVTFVIGLIFAGVTQAPGGEEIFYISLTFQAAMWLLIGALSLARRLGVRLVLRSPPIFMARVNGSASPSQGSPPNETSPELAAPGLE
jgi:hypothetical protein